MKTEYMYRGWVLICIILGLCVHNRDLSGQIPEHWQDIHDEMTSDLILINQILDVMPGSRSTSTVYSLSLGLANSNRGYDLIEPENQHLLLAAIDSSLAEYTELGFKGIDIALNYPMLVDLFPHHAEYLMFYEAVVQMARDRDFEISIGAQIMFTDSVFGEARLKADIEQFYVGLTSSRYLAEKTQMVQTIIDHLAPDYLTLEMEPGTMRVNTDGMVNFDPDSVVFYVNHYLSEIDAGSTKLGAGSGTWDDMVYIEKLAAETDIDFIDFHVYPINYDFFYDRVFHIDSVSKAHDKELFIGEAWAYKISDEELWEIEDPVATAAGIYARDMFDFWLPVDSLFCRAVMNLSSLIDVKFTSFFEWTLCFGYLSYDPDYFDSHSFKQILKDGQTHGFTKMMEGGISPLGRMFSEWLTQQTAVTGTSFPGSSDIRILGNYPNPFNAWTALRFEVCKPANIILDVIDIRGRKVSELVSGPLHPGYHEMSWHAADAASGLYFLRIRTESFTASVPCLLMK